ncbi:hypothetical protein C0Q70_20806 [Pomacea canaliculata]|uniref:Uncharacterized protein n=1 Tax=Pomacea canaliculata TaxID=400727 RepID=A0A2T7NAQ7_POMCA|nr:hypothetical protein C0Q70_20806 [Pomacea canaliculata]
MAFYKRSWQWADGTMAYFVKIFGMTRRPACATLRRFENEPVVDLPTLWPGACDEQGFFHYMCEAQDEAALPVPFEDKSFSVTGSPPSCISLYEWCDGQEQCVNQADEQLCYGEKMEDIASLPPPAILDFATNGTFVVRPLGVALSASGNETQCPGTHFRKRKSREERFYLLKPRSEMLAPGLSNDETNIAEILQRSTTLIITKDAE